MILKLSSSLFKKYDIRGRAEGDAAPLSVDAAYLIGRAVATLLQRAHSRTQAVVGRDNRASSPALMHAAMHGLREGGLNVIDLGMVATPLVYWHAVQHDNAGGVMVTGSHLAPDQNGFKLSVGARNLYGDDIQAIRTLIEADDFESGAGALKEDPIAIETYALLMKLRLIRRMTRPLDIVVDAGNGVAGLIAPALFEAWGHRVTRLFCEPDGRYPNHQPDPQVPENLKALRDAVLRTGADIGIAFDGDADRMGAVDEHGQIVTADRLLALLAQDMLARRPHAAVVADVLTSQALFDAVENAGGRAVMWASGHSLVKAKMTEIGALLGGEMSGHLFLAEDYYGFDDPFLAAGRLLTILIERGESLSSLNAALPAYYSTPEYRPPCPDERKAEVIQGVKRSLHDVGELVEVDGVRARFERGWGLIRASNTEPVLSLRFEGRTEADALAYRDLFFAALRQYPFIEVPI